MGVIKLERDHIQQKISNSSPSQYTSLQCKHPPKTRFNNMSAHQTQPREHWSIAGCIRQSLKPQHQYKRYVQYLWTGIVKINFLHFKRIRTFRGIFESCDKIIIKILYIHCVKKESLAKKHWERHLAIFRIIPKIYINTAIFYPSYWKFTGEGEWKFKHQNQ